MADDLRAADVFKVFVETNASMRQALESNVKALTEIVGTIRTVEQAMRDQSAIIGEIKTFMLDFERVQQQRQELFIAELKKANDNGMLQVQKAHQDAKDELSKTIKTAEDKVGKNDKTVIYWLIGFIAILVTALIGLVGTKIVTTPEFGNIPISGSNISGN